MGKGGTVKGPTRATQVPSKAMESQAAAQDAPGSTSTEARFLAALQKMMGGAEMTDDAVRQAIAKMTPEQKQQLMHEAGGQELKREMLTNEDSKQDRNLYFQEVNRTAEEAGLPVDKDNTHLAKRISTFMQGSSDDIPQSLLEDALASTPYMVKAALAEARDSKASAVASDLAEIEAALTLLKVTGWCQDEAAGRPPFVRRNLLLLHSHMHRDRLKALDLSAATHQAAEEVVSKCQRLLDVLFAYAVQLQWSKASLAITSLQALLVNGLWDHADDECRSLMKSRLGAVGLKAPKLALRCTAADVGPGETLTVKVSVSRAHAYSAAELEAYTAANCNAEVAAGGEGGDVGADAQEGWWLLVESLRILPNLGKAGMMTEEVSHNVLVSRQALSPALDDPTIETAVQFTAPSSPGEYKILVHVRSSSMVGFDTKRKVSFTVKNRKTQSQPSTSSGTSTEDSKSMEEVEATIADMAVEEVDAPTAPPSAP
mmetsp:Transcript_13937/g.35982  ORF Transcript_13937/g.35982 Transcript_13937/m.35982 type:complete len:486 (-) Transcript_13937:149-1606(-)|eukprot:CAMPEP_0115868022 /NCGR_PEP_ID=MMETSP0287-20121206/21070_1 /TAXON_ID=412157 /ORGANISM="Chrysochromulina rotalis, Strain UIO044" /LENGTH=485 /DNA_ID=CAMNT_0003322647 /DNA_START=37 /DNA_END=1494 /DNA_ORIENTATION=-